MKKILVAMVIAITGLVASASASDMVHYVGVNGGTSTIGNVDATVYGLTFGGEKVLSEPGSGNGLLVGMDVYIDAYNFDTKNVSVSTETTIYGYGVNGKLGYTWNGISAFGLLSGGGLDTGYTYSYGAGIEYKLFSHMTLGANYETGTYALTGGDFDIDSARGYLRFDW